MKCQNLFSWKNKKNINLSPAELAQRVVKAQINYDTEYMKQAGTQCFLHYCMCAQRSFNSAFASVQSHQRITGHYVGSQGSKVFKGRGGGGGSLTRAFVVRL